ncbi:MAG: HAMP domain-containing sensor histidine kinase [Bacteroidota bacterium]
MSISVDIYNQKNYAKIIILLILMIVAGLSIFYTDKIVTKLEEREEQQIKLYAEALQYTLKQEMDQDVNSFMTLLMEANRNTTVQAIYKTVSGELVPINKFEGFEGLKYEDQQIFLKEKLAEIIKDDHEPMSWDNGLGSKEYIYYSDSKLLTQLRYYPIYQLITVLIFGLITYFAFSYSRKSEQNRVWVGLAKETAHQLGTPLSSLTAWVEYFKSDPKYDPEIIMELEKDVQRLDVITTRFSNIGSVPLMKEENLYQVVESFLSYLQKRISSKIDLTIDNQLDTGQTVKINRYLFEWVIENVCKNAVDAMGGTGQLVVVLKNNLEGGIVIDVSDSGKGIAKNNLKKIFNPGFSTKKRGWGLGLTLAKRIVENYHKGKLLVKKSEINKGTTFRILLPQ